MNLDIIKLLKKMDSKIDKNTLLLECISKKVNIIAEVQELHVAQDEKQLKN
ncbi:hypothetical protein CLPU_2c02100 [Gottschalkia purinilytica]|uniref:Uncharacterized protein n=1 Tax=Gottschalkia purinilytica TaxID=1503 RepID=A0A0L0WE53_GOTPU|nr:hypothetical protein [Gottschalkia purinilytica]KNF09758.1 hypothetical protein CLPU_2c02100 [Gottschalkia purinilytica]